MATQWFQSGNMMNARWEERAKYYPGGTEETKGGGDECVYPESSFFEVGGVMFECVDVYPSFSSWGLKRFNLLNH